MNIRLGDPSRLADLRHHFERSGFAVEQAADDAISVQRPDAPSPEQNSREVVMHLAVWFAVNRDAVVEVVEENG